VLFVGHPDSFLRIKFGKPLAESVNSCEGKRADPARFGACRCRENRDPAIPGACLYLRR
jgi:hypothetical protein